MGKKIRVWDGTAWQDVSPSLPYTAIHSAQASMPATGVDGQVWLDTDGTLADTAFVPLSGGTMTGNLNTPSINNGPIVGRNKIINGDMGIWQRGITGFSNGGFTTDRMLSDNGAVVSRSTDAPDGFAYSMKYTSPGAVNCVIRHGIELPVSGNPGAFTDGSTWTFSIYAKSSVAGKILTLYATFADGSNGTARKLVVNNISIGTLTTSWARYTYTFTIPAGSISTANCLQITPYVVTPSSDIHMTGMQVEQGNQATPYHNATPNQQTELAACQRYYWQTDSATTYFYSGFTYSSTIFFSQIPYPVTMRTAPSLVTTGSGSDYRILQGGSFIATSAPTLETSQKTVATLRYTGSGYTVGFGGAGSGSTSNAYLGFSAEL
jgi:hypothetical protein